MFSVFCETGQHIWSKVVRDQIVSLPIYTAEKIEIGEMDREVIQKVQYRGGWKEFDLVDGEITAVEEGMGIMSWEDGGRYEGEFEDGTRSGRGVYIFPGMKRIYKGGFQNNKFHGNGILAESSGRYYEGEWSKGVKHGRGTEVDDVRNMKLEGEWFDGLRVDPASKRTLGEDLDTILEQRAAEAERWLLNNEETEAKREEQRKIKQKQKRQKKKTARRKKKKK